MYDTCVHRTGSCWINNILPWNNHWGCGSLEKFWGPGDKSLKYLKLLTLLLWEGPRRVFSQAHGGSVHALGKPSAPWRNRDCISLFLSFDGSVLFSSILMPPCSELDTEALRLCWDSDPAEPGKLYIWAFVMGLWSWVVMGRSPTWHDGMKDQVPIYNQDPGSGGLWVSAASCRGKPKLFLALPSLTWLEFRATDPLQKSLGNTFSNILQYSGWLKADQGPARSELHNYYLPLAEIWSGLSD